jgi:DNA-binding transcriptional MerR regulator
MRVRILRRPQRPTPVKPPRKLFKIGEILRYYASPQGNKISRQTLHNYTQLGLIAEAERTESGHRLYDESVFERLRRIDLYKLHHSLQEVKALLDQQDREAAAGSKESGAGQG